MKVLTLHQPWASLVALGIKTVETRSWSTSYRGPLAIHAAAKPSVYAGTRSDGWTFLYDTREAGGPWIVEGPAPDYHRVLLGDARPPSGAIVATCQLVDVVPIENLIHEPTAQMSEPWGHGHYIVDFDAQLPYGDFRCGRFAWLLDKIEPVDLPVPFRGGQRLTREWAA